MNISINGNAIKVAEELTLHNLLIQHEYAEKIGIAVAVNQSVIPKSKWKNTTIQNQDHILIIAATKGG